MEEQVRIVLRELMARHALSQTKLSAIMGVDPGFLSYFLSGKRAGRLGLWRRAYMNLVAYDQEAGGALKEAFFPRPT